MSAKNDINESFDSWESKIKNDYPVVPRKGWRGWRRIGEEWLVSARDNGTYTQNAFHICRESHQRSDTIVELDERCACGAEVPEGIRMVALLLETL